MVQDEVNKYAWQDEVPKLWAKTGFRGVLEAVVSAGKTNAGCKCIQYYREFMGEDSVVWVVSNRKSILDQWEEYLERYDIDADIMTYQRALSRLARDNRPPDLLVADECHTLNARESGKVLDYDIPHILGMSGTPDGSEKRIGPIFRKVPFEEANIAPTTIHYLMFEPSKDDMEKYNKESAYIRHVRDGTPMPPGLSFPEWLRQHTLEGLYIRRRSVTYNFDSRIPIAIDLIRANLGRRMAVFCMHNKQVRTLSKKLNALRIPHYVHITGKEELDRFQAETEDDFAGTPRNIILSCKKISEGFSDPSLDTGIIVSTALSKLSHMQTVGRILRPREGKEAHVFVLIAKGTTDESLYNTTFPAKMKKKEEWSEWKTQSSLSLSPKG